MRKEWLEAIKSGNLERVLSLLDAGADINSLDRHGQTALMNAALAGDFELAHLLVDRGAEMDHTGKYNLTALMTAVINKRLEIVRLLVDAGADVEIMGSSGVFFCTPAEYSKKHGYDEITEVFR